MLWFQISYFDKKGPWWDESAVSANMDSDYDLFLGTKPLWTNCKISGGVCHYIRSTTQECSAGSMYQEKRQAITSHMHDDVIKWKHFPRYWPCVRGIHRSPVNSPHKGQWRGALIFSLICARINGWVNNREAGDFRRNGAHYDVIVMNKCVCIFSRLLFPNAICITETDRSSHDEVSSF